MQVEMVQKILFMSFVAPEKILLFHVGSRKVLFAPELQLIFFESYICEFQKILEKVTGVGNGVSHKRVKFQFEILYIMGYTKITKSGKT